MAGARGNTELRERVNEAKNILTLRDGRMQLFRICAINGRSLDTRCLVVLEGFNGKQGKQYFWERQRTGNTLTKENEECDYKKGRHAETYVLARLDLYLEEEEEERSIDDLNKRTKNIEISKNGKSKQRQNADVQQKDAVQQKKIVTIYTNYSPCEKTNTEKYAGSKSCKKRIIEFLTDHSDITMNINYVNKYNGKSGEKSDINEDLKRQEQKLIQNNRLNIRSPLEEMIDEMERIIRER